MRITNKFLKLTSSTYPHGTEALLEQHLPEGYQIDKFGNYYLSIGENYSTMFACHLDTACKNMVPVKHRFHRNHVTTDGTTILGADDKAGMVVVLYMIENKVPGLYYFFLGEEVGCIGSSALSRELDKKELGDYPKELDNIKKVVSFDRRGTTSVITSQLYGECCSDEFANALCFEINKSDNRMQMKPDPTGVMTDSAQFMTNIPECTNISVGYYGEHTVSERQDLLFLTILCNAIVKVDWESLPIKRVPGVFNWWDEWDDFEPNGGVTTTSVTSVGDYSKDLFTHIKEDGERKKVYISKTWINHEMLLIQDMFSKQGRSVDEILWDGVSLWARDTGSQYNTYIGGRADLAELIEGILEIPMAHLKYNL